MSTDAQTIKAYDQNATKWSRNQKNGTNVGHEYLEKPAMYSKLPDLKGKDVLCIGCGSGEECEHLQSLGSKKVVGTDISSGLIDEAKKSYPGMEFFVMDMEKLEFEDNSFDLVYSSLAVHYIDDWSVLMNEVFRILKPGGILLFSTMHPSYTGCQTDVAGDVMIHHLGRTKNSKVGEYTVVGDYLTERKLPPQEMSQGLTVTWYHKPIVSVVRYCLKAGFLIEDLDEPRILEVTKEIKPKAYIYYSKLPMFLVMKLRKK